MFVAQEGVCVCMCLVESDARPPTDPQPSTIQLPINPPGDAQEAAGEEEGLPGALPLPGARHRARDGGDRARARPGRFG